ncbi:hypothetical protein PVAG01_00784 [Phlyctema vagabunda]|uniref:Uncharacterized protein n=1 Tax=Phlyctema vagabunda TaxID=108571 RepID=A0ABR4PVA1_9HELO
MPAYIPTHAARDASQGLYPRSGTVEKKVVSSGDTYIPSHATKDTMVSLRPSPAKKVVVAHVTHEERPSAYVPRHAAIDHARSTPKNIKKLSVKVTKMEFDHPLLDGVGILPTDASEKDFQNEKYMEHVGDYDDSDYESFLSAYQVAMTRVTMARQTSPITDTHAVRELGVAHRPSIISMSSFSQHRRGSSASFMEKIGSYIKPPRSESAWGQHSPMASPVESRRGSIMTSDDRSSWSRSSTFINESSRDRDSIAIEKAVRDAWKADANRRSRMTPPTSPGFKRFGSTTTLRSS